MPAAPQSPLSPFFAYFVYLADDLSSLLRIFFVLASLVLASPSAPAGTPPAPDIPGRTAIQPDDLDRAIRETLTRPQYSWRMPRERRTRDESQPGFWSSFAKTVGRWLEKPLRTLKRWWQRFQEWLDRAFADKQKPAEPNINWPLPTLIWVYTMLTFLACVLGIILYRLWRRRIALVGRQVQAQPVVATPDLLKEDIRPDELPSDAWMKLARECLGRGEYRLAIRAMFLAALAFLSHRGKLTVARHKSNREYLLELRRRAHDDPAMLRAFADNLLSLERVWYGAHPATPDLADAFSENLRRIVPASPPDNPAGGPPS